MSAPKKIFGEEVSPQGMFGVSARDIEWLAQIHKVRVDRLKAFLWDVEKKSWQNLMHKECLSEKLSDSICGHMWTTGKKKGMYCCSLPGPEDSYKCARGHDLMENSLISLEDQRLLIKEHSENSYRSDYIDADVRAGDYRAKKIDAIKEVLHQEKVPIKQLSPKEQRSLINKKAYARRLQRERQAKKKMMEKEISSAAERLTPSPPPPSPEPAKKRKRVSKKKPKEE